MTGDAASAALAMDMNNPDENAIQDFLEVLEKHRLDCEAQGKYEEAEVARTRLEQLRQHEENRRREELRSQQLAERLGVEEAHMKELQEFNEIWDRKAAEFEAHAGTLQGTLAQRHGQEHGAEMERLQKFTPPVQPKWSKDLLNLRKIQESLAKQKKYTEADKTKKEADAVEAKQAAIWKAKRDAKIAALEEQFLNKQNLEMAGLLKRIQSGREEQKQARKAELDRLLQRYHNVKSQLESQQKIITQRIERYPVHQGRQLSNQQGSRPGSALTSKRGGYPASPGPAPHGHF